LNNSSSNLNGPQSPFYQQPPAEAAPEVVPEEVDFTPEN